MNPSNQIYKIMSRQDNIYNSKLAEQAERYDDMIEYMKNIITVLNFLTLGKC